MIDFGTVIENIQDFLSEKKKPVLVSCILVIFFCAALIVVSFAFPKKAPAPVQFRSEPLQADQDLILPQGPSVPKGYAVSRMKKEKWTDSEINEWLLLPDEGAVEGLSKSNDSLVDTITGAAP